MAYAGLMLFLVPAESDTALLARDPWGVLPEGVTRGTVPTYSRLVPLPPNLVPTDPKPCSECPAAGMETWRPNQRNARGVCAIRGRGCICAKAAQPGAQGLETGLLILFGGVIVPMGWDRFRRVWTGRNCYPSTDPSIPEVILYTRAYALYTSARVVLLRDGVEVHDLPTAYPPPPEKP